MFKLRLGSRRIPNSMRRLDVLALAAPWLLVLSSAAAGFDTVKITDDSTEDWLPDISGSSVVWQHCDGGTGLECAGGWWEIQLWDGATTTQITNNGAHGRLPRISGSNVVWDGSGGIFFWDGTTVSRISETGFDDTAPDISGSSVVWNHCDGGGLLGCSSGDWEIQYWKGFITVWVTNNSADDWYPAISGSNVVWEGHDGNDDEIYMTTLPCIVPSISFGGLTLLAGLVLGVVAWAGRSS